MNMQQDARQHKQQKKKLHKGATLPCAFMRSFGEDYDEASRADVCLHDLRAPVWTLLLDLVQHAVWNAVVVGKNDCVLVASDQLATAVGDL